MIVRAAGLRVGEFLREGTQVLWAGAGGRGGRSGVWGRGEEHGSASIAASSNSILKRVVNRQKLVSTRISVS